MILQSASPTSSNCSEIWIRIFHTNPLIGLWKNPHIIGQYNPYYIKQPTGGPARMLNCSLQHPRWPVPWELHVLYLFHHDLQDCLMAKHEISSPLVWKWSGPPAGYRAVGLQLFLLHWFRGETVDGIPNNHLGCINPVNNGKNYLSTGEKFFHQQNHPSYPMCRAFIVVLTLLLTGRGPRCIWQVIDRFFLLWWITTTWGRGFFFILSNHFKQIKVGHVMSMFQMVVVALWGSGWSTFLPNN